MYKLWVEIIGSWLLGCCFRVPFHMLCAKIGSVFGCAFCGGGKSIAIVIYRVAVVRRSHIIARALSTNLPRRQQSPRTLTHTHTRSCHPHYTYCISQTYVTVGWMGSVCVCVFVSCEFRLCNSMLVAVMVDVGIAPGSPKNAAHWAVCVCVWLGGNALCSHPPTIIPRMQGRTNYVKKRAAARCALVKIQINML